MEQSNETALQLPIDTGMNCSPQAKVQVFLNKVFGTGGGREEEEC